jgi:hypothetical protein
MLTPSHAAAAKKKKASVSPNEPVESVDGGTLKDRKGVAKKSAKGHCTTCSDSSDGPSGPKLPKTTAPSIDPNEPDTAPTPKQ